MLFNSTPLERVTFCLTRAQKDLINVQNNCTLAKLALQDAGRETQATALEMICESLRQSEKDIVRWREMAQRTRENGVNHDPT